MARLERVQRHQRAVRDALEALGSANVERRADDHPVADDERRQAARFHDRVQAAVAQATAGTEPGPERIVLAVEAYLDVCLDDRAVKALALEARADGALTGSMEERHERFAAAAIPSFRAMGWPDARAASQLLAAMTAELAIRELQAGRRIPGARRALARFVRGHEET